MASNTSYNYYKRLLAYGKKDEATRKLERENLIKKLNESIEKERAEQKETVMEQEHKTVVLPAGAMIMNSKNLEDS